MFKSLTKLSGYAMCALIPVVAFAQSAEPPLFDSFSYTRDPLFTPLLVRSRIVVPPKLAGAAANAAPRMSPRDERDLRLAIDKATAEILKLTVDYTQLLKSVDTLRAELAADKSGWTVFSDDPAENADTAQSDTVRLEAALNTSRKQVIGLETQLALIQERLNAAQANFEGENSARLLTEERLLEARQQLADASETVAKGGTAQNLETELQQRDARITQLELDLAASRAKLEATLKATPVLVTAPEPVAVTNSASESITDLVLAVPVREWIIAGLEFELGSADIRKGTEENLDALLTYLQQKPKTQIQVDGYTDSIGSIVDNLKLSRDRAQAVADYLIQGGIDAHRIRVVGYGEGRPIATNMYQAGRAQNRRVAIIFFDAPE